jgi:hypothetical protein
MKSIFSIALLVITASHVTLGQTGNTRAARSSKTEREVQTLENDRVQALLRGDIAALERIYSDDYTVMSTIGLVSCPRRM